MKVILTVEKGPEQGRSIEFCEPRGFLIGRSRDADFRLPESDPYVSRRHLFLEVCPPRIRLQSLGTTNPAHVNRQPVSEHDLAHGDVIELGYTQLRVSIESRVTPEVFPCKGCGEAIEVLPGDERPERCSACMAEDDRRRRRRSVGPQPASRHCVCGTDLSERANCDGRGEELGDSVLYRCEKCLPKAGSSGRRHVGPYELLSELGSGGFGTVHLAYHPETARLVALKIMNDLSDRLLAKRFEREVRLHQNLKHPNIVRYVDAGLDENERPYLVTQFIPGGSLEQLFVREGGRLDVASAIPIMEDLLDGVAFIHAHKIIHRDIKPDNILMGEPTKGDGRRTGVAKIADFGLAVSYARAGGTRVTKRGTGMGTLVYMPPEQIRDVRSVRETADTYAAGVTLYYLLTGAFTFDFPTPAEIEEFRRRRGLASKNPEAALRELMQLNRIQHPFQIVLSEEPTPIRARKPDVPRQLAEVIDRAVRKEAGARFESAHAFRKALSKAVRR